MFLPKLYKSKNDAKSKSQTAEEFKSRSSDITRLEKQKKKENKEALKQMHSDMFGSNNSQIKQKHYILRAIEATDTNQKETEKKKRELSSGQDNNKPKNLD